MTEPAARLPRRAWLLITLVLVWGALGLYLSFKLGWPSTYGVHCYGRCFDDELAGSAVLVRRGAPLDLLMFAWLWSWPAIALWQIAYLLVSKLQRGRP